MLWVRIVIDWCGDSGVIVFNDWFLVECWVVVYWWSVGLLVFGWVGIECFNEFGVVDGSLCLGWWSVIIVVYLMISGVS